MSVDMGQAQSPLQPEQPPCEAMRNAVTLRTMTQDDLDAVLAIEQAAYSHPWSRGNFRDSLNPMFDAQCLWFEGELLGYFLAMHGVNTPSIAAGGAG